MSDISDAICAVLRNYDHEYTAAASGNVIYIDSLVNEFPIHVTILIYLYSDYCDITTCGPGINHCINVEYTDPDIFNKILISIEQIKKEK